MSQPWLEQRTSLATSTNLCAFMFVVDKLGLKSYHCLVGGRWNVYMLELQIESRGMKSYEAGKESEQEWSGWRRPFGWRITKQWCATALILLLHHFHHLRRPIEKCLFPVLKPNQWRTLQDNGNEHEKSETRPGVFVSLSLAAPMQGRQPSSSESAIQRKSRKFSTRRVTRYSMF